MYAFITTSGDDRVVRMALTGGGQGAPDGGTLADPQPILTGIPSGASDHGGRIGFGPDGMLYVGVGDEGDPGGAQDPAKLVGKILRVTPDGQPAPGNPTAGSPVWASGFHNPTAFGWDDQGRMYGADQGVDQQDEVDLLQAGGNYGWPLVQGTIGTDVDKSAHTGPLVTWYFKDATPQGLLVTGDAVYVVGSRNRVWRIPRNRDSLGAPQALYQDVFLRLRDIAAGPDGTLWVVTCNTEPVTSATPRAGDDRVARIPLG